MDDETARATVRQFLLDFVEDRDRSVKTAAVLEPLARDLAEHDARFEVLEVALATYDGRTGAPEPGMLNQEAFAFECRQVLHDLGEHRHCVHDRAYVMPVPSTRAAADRGLQIVSGMRNYLLCLSVTSSSG